MKLPKRTPILALSLSLLFAACGDGDDPCVITPGVWRVDFTRTADSPESCTIPGESLRIESFAAFAGPQLDGSGCTSSSSSNDATCTLSKDTDCDGNEWAEEYSFDTATTGRGQASSVACSFDVTLVWESE